MKAIIAAVIGGLVGALLWGAIAHFTGYEVVYVAWAIGGLIGFLSAMAGGEGFTNGAICAAVAALSLIAGKFVAVKMSVSAELTPMLEPMYEEQKQDAAEFAKLESKDDWGNFIYENGYTEVESVEDISTAELMIFEATTVPMLEKLNAGMTYNEYEAEIISEMGGTMDIIKDSFGVMDILFFGLGIYTAFKLGAGGGDEEVA